jgi:hypothetical protein
MGVRRSDALRELESVDVGLHELACLALFDDDDVKAGSCSTSLETSSKSCQRPQVILQLWTSEAGRCEAFRLGPDTQGGQLSLRSLRLIELTA